jgi:hypothetical protein
MNTNVPEFGQKGSSTAQPGCDSVTYHAMLVQSGNTFAEVVRDHVNAFRDWACQPV